MSIRDERLLEIRSDKECRVETPQSITDITAIDRVVSGILARLCSIVCGYSHTDGLDIDGRRTEPTRRFPATYSTCGASVRIFAKCSPRCARCRGARERVARQSPGGFKGRKERGCASNAGTSPVGWTCNRRVECRSTENPKAIRSHGRNACGDGQRIQNGTASHAESVAFQWNDATTIRFAGCCK